MYPALSWLLFGAACTADPHGEPVVRPAVRPDAAVDPPEAVGDTGGPVASVPSQILDLTNWKLTLPIGDPGEPTEIVQSELASYTIEPYFEVGGNGDVVVFMAHAGGVTTDSSMFPRSELREMTSDGSTKASWSTTSGRHTMTITQAITHLPDVVPHVVAGQIHDEDEYVVLVRLDGQRLWVKSNNGSEEGVLDPAYVLGTEFTLRITAADGLIHVYYNDLANPAVSVPYDTTGCYFRAGAYSQSNTDYGDAPESYAEVRVRSLVISHE